MKKFIAISVDHTGKFLGTFPGLFESPQAAIEAAAKGQGEDGDGYVLFDEGTIESVDAIESD